GAGHARFGVVHSRRMRLPCGGLRLARRGSPPPTGMRHCRPKWKQMLWGEGKRCAIWLVRDDGPQSPPPSSGSLVRRRLPRNYERRVDLVERSAAGERHGEIDLA